LTSSRVLARNSALNLAGQVLPLVVAAVAIPLLIRGLGAERFGILTLAWAAIGYFGLFEFGLSRALTQAVAARLGADNHEDLPTVMWSALLLLFGLGVVGGAVLSLATPLLVKDVLDVPSELQREAILAFWILAASLPLVLLSVGLRGVMEAYQHFGMATALRVPLSAFMYLGPLISLTFSRSLVPAVTMVAIGRAAGCAAHLIVCIRAYPALRQPVRFHRAPVLALVRYGGWSTVSNIISPLMVTMDRFLIGALLPLATVTHYVTPYEVVTKLIIIPIAMLGAVFPVFASTFEVKRDRMVAIYERSLRLVGIAMFPVILVAIGLAHEGLGLWVGSALPAVSAVVLQVLAVGAFTNGIAQVPLSALQGSGRPDLVAKLHMVELPFYAVGLWFFATTWGLPGVALAWTARVTIDALALLGIATWKMRLPFAPTHGGWWPATGMLVMFVVAGALGDTVWRVAFLIACTAIFVPLAWFRLLTETERRGLLAWIESRRGNVSAAEGGAA
jgi:O-antigen/teichoic acid export membrane protein